ncbi:hypothetical protein POTOM_015508 [Populus tomentosa]|uniref:Protein DETOXIFICATION n=1 Tax=Populus tomentosa TaxID=118781 RepID=A0A8X8D5L4_POPTO|nr:hypothetical protein POTOM_015508 [Populus tomentosa]
MADNMGWSCGGAQGGELHSCTNGGCYGVAVSATSCVCNNRRTPCCADDGLVKLGVSSGAPLCLFLSATCVLSYPFGLSSGGSPEPTRDDGYAGHLGLMVTLAVTSRRKKTQNSFTCREVMEEEGKREERKWAITWEGFVQELKKAGYIAAPMVVVSVLQYLLQVVSVIIVGHLGALALASAAIATSITNVTGFSLLVCLLILSF